MNCTIQHVRFPLILVVVVSLMPTLVCSENPSPGPQQSLLPMLQIDWKRGPNLPQGFQDSDGEYYGHHPDLFLQGRISTLPR